MHVGTIAYCTAVTTQNWRSNADFAAEWVIASKGTKRKVGGKKSVFSQFEEEYSIGTDNATQSKVPALVMWYLPVEDRLKRLFSNPKTAELMTWHADRLRSLMGSFDILLMLGSGGPLIPSTKSLEKKKEI
jgi:hypothetical protein